MTINIVPAKVESLFLRNLYIPEHQRGYAWKKVHADDFFEDLIGQHSPIVANEF